ncbi:MAG: FtsX-like permease family protein [Candidatus Acidiferrales bacterium]
MGTALWKPWGTITPDDKFDLRVYPNLGVIGRLKAGVTWARAQTEMDTIAARLAAQYPKDDAGIGIRIVPLREQLSQKVSQGLLVLWAAIFGVLLIACVNAANLMMARAAGRQKEIVVRFSLGATCGRIVRQFLAESLLLAAVGAATGLFLAYWTVALVSKFNPDIGRLGGSILDLRVLLYTIAVAAFTAIICAILPAFSASRLDLNRALKETSSGSASPGTQLIRKFSSSPKSRSLSSSWPALAFSFAASGKFSPSIPVSTAKTSTASPWTGRPRKARTQQRTRVTSKS